jgi:hypothetical protein
LLLSLLPAVLVALAGCSKDAPKEQAKGEATTSESKNADDSKTWWCAEHGVPEDECSMCSDKIAKECKAKGDWCEKHERAKSQCFICDPSLKEKYAARYRVRYGKEPPPPKENMPESEDKKDDKK